MKTIGKLYVNGRQVATCRHQAICLEIAHAVALSATLFVMHEPIPPNKPEVMSPAGYWPQLHAAIEA
ncbi:MAG TPA: hypothetical protein PLK31_10980, partial [Chloroflexota bacterium]|nr:hypothetical protein [Chloroflexota bacterium]